MGPVLFDDGPTIVRWLAFSNGLGYLVGAIVGHFLLRHRLGTMRMTNVGRTTSATFGASIAGCAVVWGITRASGLDRLSDDHGKIASLGYLALTAVVSLGLIYSALVLLRVPDVIAVSVAVRRMLGRVIPAVAPKAQPPTESVAEMTVAFPRITGEESTPYSGQVQVMRRFDTGTSRWQAYSDYTGGAVGQRPGGGPPRPGATPPDMRYRRRGVGFVGEGSDPGRAGVDRPEVDDPGSRSDATPPRVVACAICPGPCTPTRDSRRCARGGVAGTRRSEETPADTPPPVPADPGVTDAPAPGPRRGPRLVPGAAVAGGRYGCCRRTAAHADCSSGVLVTSTRPRRRTDLRRRRPDRAVPAAGVAVGSRGEGPQAVLSGPCDSAG